jgi:hypothetical protein
LCDILAATKLIKINEMERAFNAMQKIGAGMIGAGFIVAQFTFVVDGGERALIMDATRGLRPGVYGEGMHFRIPIIH